MATLHKRYKRWNGISWDEVLIAPATHTHDAADVASGTLADARIPALAISKITNLQSTLDNRIYYGDVLMPTNVFGGKKLYINELDNAFFAADKRFNVTVTRHLKVYNSENYPKLNPDYVASYSYSGSGTTYTITNNPIPADIIVYVNDTLCSQVTTPTNGTQYSYSSSTGVVIFGATPSGTIYIYPGPTIVQYLDSPISSTLTASQIFDGSYETNLTTGTQDYYMKVRISAGVDGKTPFSNFQTYSYGTFFLSYYYAGTSEKAEYRVYNYGYRPHVIGWKKYDFTDYIGTNNSTAYIQSYYDSGNHGRSIMEFIIYGKTPNTTYGSYQTSLSEIDWRLDRPDLAKTGSTVTKYGENKLYYRLLFGTASASNVIIDPAGSITVLSQYVVLNNDARLSDARVASDVYAWAKASTKPAYTYSEVGAAAASHTHGNIANDGKIGSGNNLVKTVNGLITILGNGANGNILTMVSDEPSWADPQVSSQTFNEYYASGTSTRTLPTGLYMIAVDPSALQTTARQVTIRIYNFYTLSVVTTVSVYNGAIISVDSEDSLAAARGIALGASTGTTAPVSINLTGTDANGMLAVEVVSSGSIPFIIYKIG